MARLSTHVHVHGPGGTVAFGPSDEVPEWARQRITNPAVWADAPPRGAAPDPAQAPAADAGAPPRPPEHGKGATRKAWAAYAEAQGYEIDDDATKADIVEAIDGEDA